MGFVYVFFFWENLTCSIIKYSNFLAFKAFLKQNISHPVHVLLCTISNLSTSINEESWSLKMGKTCVYAVKKSEEYMCVRAVHN